MVTHDTHHQAARLYQSVHQNEASRCSNLAYYSTCLWYTQREIELSALAHEMLEANKNSPEVSLFKYILRRFVLTAPVYTIDIQFKRDL